MKDRITTVVVAEGEHKSHSHARIIEDHRIGESERFAHINCTDLQTAIQLATELWPNQAFCFLNEGRLFEQVKRLQQLFLPGDPRATIAYAIKANPRGRILEVLHAAGLDTFDSASPGEIAKTLRFCPSSTALFTHPFKFPEEITAALASGIRYFTVQTRNEVAKILDVTRSCDVPEQELELAVRLRSLNQDASINLSQKFGTDERTVRELLMLIRQESKAQAALSTNTGSQNHNPQSYRTAIKKLAALASTIDGVSSLNLGGGFPVNYHPEDAFCLKDYLDVLNSAIRDDLHGVLHGPHPRVIIEPGRALIAEAVDMVIPIRGVEERGGEKVVFIDDGVFTSFSDSIIHPGWEFNITSLHKPKSNNSLYTVYGRTCDSGDKLPYRVSLPEDLTEGEYLILNNSGAYTESAASICFNGFSKPKYLSYNDTSI